jgi:hypothetical protein
VKTYERFKLLADLRPGCVIGFNKQEYKLYDHSILFWIAAAIFPRYKAVARLFGIEHPHYHYHLPGDAFERESQNTAGSAQGSQLCIAINPLPPQRIKTFAVIRFLP